MTSLASIVRLGHVPRIWKAGALVVLVALAYAAVAVVFDMPGRKGIRHIYRILEGIETLDGTYDIAVLGDSNARRGKWHRLFSGRRMGNFGEGGEEVAEIARRVDETIASKPHSVFVLAGVNDLIHDRDPLDAARSLRAIIDPLRARGSVVYVNSLVCGIATKSRMAKMPFVDCDRVRAFNRFARTVSGERGAVFIDLTAALMVADELRPEFTDDGLHLNDTGYRAVHDVWMGYLR